jgi:glycosidase
MTSVKLCRVSLAALTLALVACGDEETPQRPGGNGTPPDLGFDVRESDAFLDGGADAAPLEVGVDAEPEEVLPEPDVVIDADDALADTEDTVSDVGADTTDVEPDISEDTTPEPDIIEEPDGPPMTVTITPADGTAALPRTTSVTLAFSEPLRRDTARGVAIDGDCGDGISLRLADEDSCLGVRTGFVDARTVTLTPNEPLPIGATLDVRVGRAVRSTGNGAVAEVVSSTFSVAEVAEPYSAPIAIDGLNDWPNSARVPTNDGKQVYVSWDNTALYVAVQGQDLTITNQAVYIVVGARLDDESPGLSYVPAERWFEGSTTLLPFHASHVFFNKTVSGVSERYMRAFNGVIWGARQDASAVMSSSVGSEFSEFRIPLSAIGAPERVAVTVYMKDLASNCGGLCSDNIGWGWMYGATDPLHIGGPGDRMIERYLEFDFRDSRSPDAYPFLGRFGRTTERPAVYQLMVRTFGNTDASRLPGGTLAENSSGRFADINERAVAALGDMGFSHIWLTGVLQQGTSTDWTSVGQSADDPDILKGRAGSPYAIRDYFDVSPDYAVNPARRLPEFREAIDRLHDGGLDVMIDFVPNHVARSYDSDIRPDLNFGEGDNRGVFFNRDNSFFYLQSGSPPVLMPGFVSGNPVSPTCEALQGDPSYRCDGIFDWAGMGETTFGRVTGNDTASWTPSLGTWYETVKLNYGYDYTTRTALHPTLASPDAVIPRTWQIMDSVISWWQAMGVDAFRVDMAHMVPPEFFGWMISRSRGRNPNVYWMAEAYDSDPAKIVAGNTLHSLLASGFDAVYDDASYDTLKSVFDGSLWANDLAGGMTADALLLHNGLRYAENHDEVRLGSTFDWRMDGASVGVTVGPAVSAVLWGAGRGPFMMYAGQETGEPASGAEGFGGDDGRTTIFDYWSMPTFQGWVNAHEYDGAGLSSGQRALRERYVDLVQALRSPAFTDGQVFMLNAANVTNPAFGRAAGETASGRRAFAFLRYTGLGGGERVLVYANLHPSATMTDVTITVPSAAWAALGWPESGTLQLRDRVSDAVFSTPMGVARSSGLGIGPVPAGGVRVLELTLTPD